MAGRSSIMLSAVNNLEYYNGLSLLTTWSMSAPFGRMRSR